MEFIYKLQHWAETGQRNTLESQCYLLKPHRVFGEALGHNLTMKLPMTTRLKLVE